MSAIGIVNDADPAASPQSYKTTGLVPAFCVVGALTVIGIALGVWRKRVRLKQILQDRDAASDGRPAVAEPPIFTVQLEKAHAATRARAQSAFREGSEKHQKLADLEEGFFGHADDDLAPIEEKPIVIQPFEADMTSGQQALRSETNRDAQSPETSLVPGPQDSSEVRSKPAQHTEEHVVLATTVPSPDASPLDLAITSAETPSCAPVLSIRPDRPVYSPGPGSIPRIAVRKATLQHPEHVTLPESPRTPSPPCSVASSMRDPPLPPSQQDLEDRIGRAL